ncbi:MAG: hypothetical protein GY868_06955 [Deltaproteobacteria bacterium]|nr:hypothetical protein [Deltaproteobacteria bacterium]
MVLIWFYGMALIISQTLLLREIVVLFQNHELVIGLLFFSWLSGSGLGSSAYRGVPEKLRAEPWLNALLLLAACLLVFLAVLLIRFAHGLLQHQADPGLAALFVLGVCLLGPVSFLWGLIFPSLTRLAGSGRISRVYVLEAAAVFCGSLVFTFGLAGRVDGIDIAMWLVIIAVIFLLRWLRERPATKAGVFMLFGIVCFGLVTLPWQEYSRRLEWPNASSVRRINSRHARIALVDDQGQTSLSYNGKLLSGLQRQEQIEEQIHLPALVHGRPEHVLVLGYAAPALLEELLRYRPRRIVNVVADRALGDLPAASRAAVVHRYEDPYAWVHRAQETYDLILLRTALPRTIADNRFFSQEFYRALYGLLKPGGVFSLSVPYEQERPSPHTAACVGMIYNTLRRTFGAVAFVPAGRFHFFAGPDANLIVSGPALISALKQRGGRYVQLSPALLRHYCSPQRTAFFRAMLDEQRDADVNTLQNMMLYRISLAKWLKNTLRRSWVVLLAVTVCAALVLLWKMKTVGQLLPAGKSGLVLFAAGFGGIAGELVLINYYQSLVGHVFYHYGLLMALYMLGMGVGGHLGRCSCGERRYAALLLFSGWLAAVITLCLAVLPRTIGTAAVFALMVVGGFVMGYLFNDCTVREELATGSDALVAARTYSFDLYGAALGALISASVLIPFAGPVPTLAGCMVLLAGAAGYAHFKYPKH